LSHVPSPFFALVIFQVGSLAFTQGHLQTSILPIPSFVPDFTDVCHHIQLIH
jgi:hypothetical protein